jgi:hypothetical protein
MEGASGVPGGNQSLLPEEDRQLLYYSADE